MWCHQERLSGPARQKKKCFSSLYSRAGNDFSPFYFYANFMLILDLCLKHKNSDTVTTFNEVGQTYSMYEPVSTSKSEETSIYSQTNVTLHTTRVTKTNTGLFLHCQHSAVLIDNRSSDLRPIRNSFRLVCGRNTWNSTLFMRVQLRYEQWVWQELDNAIGDECESSIHFKLQWNMSMCLKVLVFMVKSESGF